MMAASNMQGITLLAYNRRVSGFVPSVFRPNSPLGANFRYPPDVSRNSGARS